MSDEFFKIGKEELNKDLNDIQNILDQCNDDNDIMKNSGDIQKKIHNIKGLSPMVGFEEIGTFFTNLDNLFKQMIDGKKFEGIFNLVRDSNTEAQKSINGESCDLNTINQALKSKFSQFLD